MDNKESIRKIKSILNKRKTLFKDETLEHSVKRSALKRIITHITDEPIFLKWLIEEWTTLAINQNNEYEYEEEQLIEKYELEEFSYARTEFYKCIYKNVINKNLLSVFYKKSEEIFCKSKDIKKDLFIMLIDTLLNTTRQIETPIINEEQHQTFIKINMLLINNTWTHFCKEIAEKKIITEKEKISYLKLLKGEIKINYNNQFEINVSEYIK